MKNSLQVLRVISARPLSHKVEQVTFTSCMQQLLATNLKIEKNFKIFNASIKFALNYLNDLEYLLKTAIQVFDIVAISESRLQKYSSY